MVESQDSGNPGFGMGSEVFLPAYGATDRRWQAGLMCDGPLVGSIDKEYSTVSSQMALLLVYARSFEEIGDSHSPKRRVPLHQVTRRPKY